MAAGDTIVQSVTGAGGVTTVTTVTNDMITAMVCLKPAMVVSMTAGVILSQRSSAMSTLATERSTNGFRLALEAISALLTTIEMTSLRAELRHADGRELSSGMVLRLVLVDFMDGDGVVHDVRLDDLLLDHRLDVLVDVVVDVFARNGVAAG